MTDSANARGATLHGMDREAMIEAAKMVDRMVTAALSGVSSPDARLSALDKLWGELGHGERRLMVGNMMARLAGYVMED